MIAITIGVLLLVASKFDCSPISIEKSQKESRISELLENGHNCLACKFLAGILQQYVQINGSKSAIANAVATVCEYLKVEDNAVCRGITTVFRVRI